jgi:hypothetical protein
MSHARGVRDHQKRGSEIARREPKKKTLTCAMAAGRWDRPKWFSWARHVTACFGLDRDEIKAAAHPVLVVAQRRRPPAHGPHTHHSTGSSAAFDLGSDKTPRPVAGTGEQGHGKCEPVPRRSRRRACRGRLPREKPLISMVIYRGGNNINQVFSMVHRLLILFVLCTKKW